MSSRVREKERGLDLIYLSNAPQSHAHIRGDFPLRPYC